MFLAELLGLLSKLMLSVESTGNETRRQWRHKLSSTSRFGRLKKASGAFEKKKITPKNISVTRWSRASLFFLLLFFLLPKLKMYVRKNRWHYKGA